MSVKISPSEVVRKDVERLGNPLVEMMYVFFTEPLQTRYGHIWGLLIATLGLSRILAQVLATCDGPNQYEGHPNKSAFKFLGTAQIYWDINIGTMIPLVVDAFVRLIMLLSIFISGDNIPVRRRLLKDPFSFGMLICDIVGVIPFIVQALILRPYGIALGWYEQLVFQIFDLFTVVHVLRITKDIPAIWAIRMALSRSTEQLILPIFFFLLFNVTLAVVFYFFEPCFDASNCPWQDLFGALFYSVVTMTTTGYGNQIPFYELGRFLACFEMVFGALFLSMPLAIIGNEYQYAWEEVSAKLQKQQLKEELERQQLELLRKTSIAEAMPKLNQVAPMPVVSVVKKEEDKTALVADFTILQDAICKAEVELVRSARLSPMLIFSLCNVEAWLPPLIVSLRTTKKTLLKESQAVAVTGGRRRLSVLGSAHPAPIVKAAEDDVQVKLTKTFKEQMDMASMTGFKKWYYKIGNATGLRGPSEREVMMEKWSKDKKSMRNRLWALLELHHSSRYCSIMSTSASSELPS